MNKCIMTAVCMAALSSVLIGSFPVSAQDYGFEIPDAGILPDSPFYFIDNLGKSLSLLFAIGTDAKTEKALSFADERLAEAMAMAAANKTAPASVAIEGYRHFTAVAVKQADKQRRELATNLDEEVANAISRQLEDIDLINDLFPGPIPEEVQESISSARDGATNGLSVALRGMALDKPELAAEISTTAAQARFSRAKFLAGKGNPAELIEAIKNGETIYTFNAQIIAEARELRSWSPSLETYVASASKSYCDMLVSINASLPSQTTDQATAEVQDAIRQAALRMPKTTK